MDPVARPPDHRGSGGCTRHISGGEGGERPLTAVTWVGHATTLIEVDGVRLLTDPVLRDRFAHLERTHPPVAREASERIDAVLLSHLHADHADIPSLRRVGAAVIAPRGAGRWLAARGLGEVHEIAAGEERHVAAVTVAATHAAHESRRAPLGPRADPVGFVVRGSSSVYFAGDTDLFAGMAALAGSIDLALVPVWGWGARLGPGHLDPERAAEATARIAPKVVVPIHWGTFAPRWPFRRHPRPDAPAREFAALVARRAPGVEVRVLAPGASTTVA